jgi:hypothetical protein
MPIKDLHIIFANNCIPIARAFILELQQLYSYNDDSHLFIIAAGQVVTDPQALAKIAKFLKDTLDSRQLCEASVTSQVVELSKHQALGGKSRRGSSVSTSASSTPGPPVDARVRVMQTELRAARSEIQATWLKDQRIEARVKSTAVTLAATKRSLAKAKRELKRLAPLYGRIGSLSPAFFIRRQMQHSLTHSILS